MGRRRKRFRVESVPRSGSVTVGAREARHMIEVLRLDVGDVVTAFDGSGQEADCVIEKAGGGRVVLSVLAKKEWDLLPEVQVTVAACVPKGRRMDFLVQKCAELGARALLPLVAERSAVRPRGGARLERWRRVSSESSKQCGRNRDMEVLDPLPFEDLVSTASEYDAALIAEPGGGNVAAAAAGVSAPKRILAAVGPEGGFTPREVELAVRSGFTPVSLGRLTLRVETAAIALVAILTCGSAR